MYKFKSMLLKLSLVIGMLPAFQTVFAQQSFQGKVIDGLSQAPLMGASVSITGAEKGTVTDGDGNFELNVPSFPVAIAVSYIGYGAVSINLETNPKEIVIRMTAETLNLDGVTLTALEGTRRLLETPASVSRITFADLERFDFRSPQQALSTMPGVKVESTTIGRYRIRIRGGNLGIVGHSDSYKMYWNGIPLTSAGGFPPLAYLDMGAVGSLDIIRGPSGSIYGGGLAGVALFENKVPEFGKTQLNLDGFSGSYGTTRAGISFATGGKNGDLRLQYSNVETDGYREEASSSNEFINLFGRVFPNDKQTISIVGIFGDRSYGISGNLTAEQVAENPRQSNFSPELDNGLIGQLLMIGAGHQYRFNDKWKNNTTFNYQVLEGSFLIGNDFFVSADQNTTTTFSLRSANTYSFKPFNLPTDLVFGVEYTRGLGDVDVFSNGFESPIVNSREIINELVLGFVQAEIKLPARTTLTIGGSYNNFRLDFQEFLDTTGIQEFERKVNDFSPRVGVVKLLSEKIAVQGNISKGFAPPPRGAFENNNRTVNNDLQSTIGWNKELGIRGSVFDDKLNFDLTFYRMDENDVIVPRVVGTAGNLDFIENENAGAIDRQGIELALLYNLFDEENSLFPKSRIWANYNYMDHTFESYNSLTVDGEGNTVQVNFDGNRVPGIHLHSIVGGLDLATKWGLYFNGTYNFYDDIFLNNENSTKDNSYQLLDLKLGYTQGLLEGIRLNVFAGVNNALDEKYSQMHGLNSGFGGFFDPGMDRNYYVGTRIGYTF